MFTISFMSLMALLSLSTSNAAEQNLRRLVVNSPPSWTGNCLNNQVCSAKEVTVRSVTTSSSITSCVAGSKVTVPVTGTFQFNAERFDFGLFLGLDGSGNTGGTCAIAPLLQNYKASYSTTGSVSINWIQDGDVCGDVSVGGGNPSGKTLTMNNIFSDVEIECKAGANGKLQLPLCFSWKQQGGNTQCKVGDLTPGTTAKCQCISVSVDSISVTQPDTEEDEKDEDEQDQDEQDQDEQDQDEQDQDEQDQDEQDQDEQDQDEQDQDQDEQDQDQDEQDQDEQDQDQDEEEQDDEDDCEDSETEKTINVGGNSALRSATKTSSTKRILLPQGATIGFDYVTKPAFDAYKVSSWFEFARSKDTFSYLFEDAAFLNSCYDYDIILGFAELDPTYCTGNTDQPKRIMKVLVNAGEGDEVVRPGFNVVDKTGGECYQAYMIKHTVTPTVETVGITVEKTEESNGDAILSFIKIKRSAQRRLGADCNKENIE